MAQDVDIWKQQWCQLHLGICENVEVLRRGRGLGSVPLLVCPKCITALKKTGVLVPTRWARQKCLGLDVAPRDWGTERVPYLVELEWVNVLLLRAMGYEVHKVEVDGDTEVEEDEERGDLQDVP